MKALITIVCIVAWWALSIGGYFIFKHGAKEGLYVPEARYNGDYARWYKEGLIAACCGVGLPLYLVYLIAKAKKK